MQQEDGTSANNNLQQINRPAPLRQTALSSPQLYSDLGKTVYTGGANPSDHAARNWPAREPHHERPPGVETWSLSPGGLLEQLSQRGAIFHPETWRSPGTLNYRKMFG
jgi:hypothetical protein